MPLEKKKASSIASPVSNYEKIIRLLKEYDSGLTIADISRMLKLSRNTVVVHLARLEGAEQINIRRIGMAKLYSLKPEFQIDKGRAND